MKLLFNYIGTKLFHIYMCVFYILKSNDQKVNIENNEQKEQKNKNPL